MKKVTKVLIILTAIILIGYDIYAAVEDTGGDTISEVMLAWAYKIPLLAYAFGVLGGHLFWPLKSTEYHLQRVLILGGTGVIILILPLVGLYPHMTPAVPLIVGVVAGHFLWGQKAHE